MNKTRILIIALIVAIVGAGYFAYTRSQTQNITTNPIKKNSTTSKPSQTMVNGAESNISGSYKDYSQDEVNATKGTRLVFFHAPWCPQCRELDESIKSSNLPDNTTIFKIDYDSNQELRKKYGVTIQTTVVKIDDNGNKISSYVAYQAPTFENVSNALLK